MSLRWGYASKEPQKRFTPKSAFLRALERKQRPAPIDTYWFGGKTTVTTLQPKHNRRS